MMIFYIWEPDFILEKTRWKKEIFIRGEEEMRRYEQRRILFAHR